jgi:acetyl esterase/lipase
VTRGAAENPFHPELRRHARFLPRTLVTPTTAKVFSAVARIRKSPVPNGSDIRLHRPPGVTRRRPALLWIHGGGYILGSAAQDDGLCRRFARVLGITVAAVDYRLAPAHPYPAPLEDCYAALVSLAALPSVDESRIAIAGASAGGGLAAALALLTRDRREIALAAQLLLYPMLDDRTADRPDPDATYRRLWNNTSNRLGWNAYLGDCAPEIAVPARSRDLKGLPRTWIGVGTLDVLYDEAVAFAQRLRAAGVPCELEAVPGAFHGFDAVAPKTGVASRFFTSQCDVLRAALAVSSH